MSVVEGGGSIDSKALAARVKAILLQPKTEWEVIDAEPATTKGLFTGYACILAAIPAVCSFIGGQVFGYGAVFVHFRPPLISSLVTAIITYVLSLVMVYVLGLIIDALAPSFDGVKDPIKATKVAVYSMTASWVAGVFGLVPALGALTILAALYDIYLLYLGLPRLMKAPEEKAIGYTAVSIIVAIVLNFVVFGIAGAIGGLALFGAGLAGAGAVSSAGTVAGTVGVPGVGSVDLGKLEQASRQMETAAKQMQASASGAPGGVQPVAGDRLQAMLPAGVAGLERGEISNQSGGVAGLSGSSAEAHYGTGDSRVNLTIVDLGGAAGFAAMGAAFNVNASKQSSTGYEKVGKINGRMTTEKWDSASRHGEYGVMVGDRFMVQAEGDGVDINALKGAVGAVNFGALEAMARS